MQPMPTGDFRWLSREEIDEINLEVYDDNSDYGLFLEVDLKYPQKLHDSHNDYPLAPEKLFITEDMLSPTSVEIFDELNLSSNSVQKLVPNLMDKKRYVLHYRNLKFYLAMGMQIECIHDAISFRQSPWIRKYIQFNTDMRTAATNESDKDYYKLLNNR
jgi:hypothetical protein